MRRIPVGWDEEEEITTILRPEPLNVRNLADLNENNCFTRSRTFWPVVN